MAFFIARIFSVNIPIYLASFETPIREKGFINNYIFWSIYDQTSS